MQTVAEGRGRPPERVNFSTQAEGFEICKAVESHKPGYLIPVDRLFALGSS